MTNHQIIFPSYRKLTSLAPFWLCPLPDLKFYTIERRLTLSVTVLDLPADLISLSLLL